MQTLKVSKCSIHRQKHTVRIHKLTENKLSRVSIHSPASDMPPVQPTSHFSNTTQVLGDAKTQNSRCSLYPLGLKNLNSS